MATGIYRQGIMGEQVEVEQKYIDAWCKQCQFPLGEGGTRCSEKWQIQLCWNLATAGEWHRQHECPFIHQGQPCRCNDFKSIKEAFTAVGLDIKAETVS